MPKILSVKVWGFQSWVNGQYDLVDGLNVFTGPSGAGKTAGTLRAMRWLAKGEPSGEGFLHTVYESDGLTIKRQAEEAGVEVKLDNGATITKTRRNGKTKYWVRPMYDEPFEKAEVPEVVKDLLGIKSVVYSRDKDGKPDLEYDLHFAYQLAAPFLISDPGSAGAKVLGKLAGTEAVDGAIKSTAKDTYAARNEKSAADKEYERKVEQLKEYEGLDDIQRQLDACEFLLGEIEEAAAKKANLGTLAQLFDKATTAVNDAALKLDNLAHVPQLVEDLVEIEKAQQRYDRLLDLYEKLGKATATVETVTQQLKDLAGLDACEWLLNETLEAEKRRVSLEALMQEYTRTEAEVKRATAIITATKDLDVVQNSLSLIEKTLDSLNSIRLLKYSYDMEQEKVSKYENLIGSLSGISEADGLVNAAEDDLIRLGTLRELFNIYMIKTRTLESAVSSVSQAQVDLKAAEKELAEAWEAAGGKCPLCEQAVAHAH